MTKSLSKEELIKQLKTLKEKEPEIPMHMGACCYSPAFPNPIEVKCENCGKEMEIMGWRSDDGSALREYVDQIKALGYDCKLECLCADCANKEGVKEKKGKKLTEDRPYFVFYFKSNDQEKYNKAISNNENDYKAVLAFLKNESYFVDTYNAAHSIKENLDIIHRMLGISVK
ncbi:MAG: hypothetical protein K5874_07400 [Bacteroidaceae bacterium]|jgi:hypothetical protein|nr:hypothetical protein [Bacteroidaceae bacterium]